MCPMPNWLAATLALAIVSRHLRVHLHHTRRRRLARRNALDVSPRDSAAVGASPNGRLVVAWADGHGVKLRRSGPAGGLGPVEVVDAAPAAGDLRDPSRVLRFVAIVVLAAVNFGAPADDAAAAPKLPPAVKKIDRHLTKASKTLGKRQTARLRGPIRSAGRLIRKRPCAAAKSLTKVVVRSRTLRGRRATAARPVVDGARKLGRRLVAGQRRKGACGLKLKVRVDKRLRPALPSLPAAPGAPSRPVASFAVGRVKTDFAEREIVFSTRGRRGLAGLLRRTRGKLISSTSSPRAKHSIHHILLPPGARISANGREGLVDDLRKLEPASHGTLRASSAAGLNTFAITADERARGLHVAPNLVFKPDASLNQAFPGQRFLDGESQEDQTDLQPVHNGSHDAFRGALFTDQGPNAYGTGDAWRRLEMANKLKPSSVRVAVIDDGFVSDYDLPRESLQATKAIGQPQTAHGYQVTQALAAVADNRKGVAGSGAPVVYPVTLRTPGYDGASTLTSVLLALNLNVRIINMSFSTGLAPAADYMGDPYADIFADAAAADVLLVAAAGNQSGDVDAEACKAGACVESTATFPCESGGVLCVGGVDVDRTTRDPESNFGRQSCGNKSCDVEIFGPFDHAVVATTSTGALEGFTETNGEFESALTTVGGTSAAAPYVAGAAALVMSAKPSLKAGQVRNALIDTANTSPDNDVSRVVDPQAAVLSQLPPQPPLVGIASPRKGSAAHTGRPERLDGLAIAARPNGCCSYRWLSDGVPLGNGIFIDAPLKAGLQKVTLEATDGDGRTGSASVLVDRDATFGTATTLTTACPAGLEPGDTAGVDGLLVPAKAGSPIALEVTAPNGSKQTIGATTDAAGGYAVSFAVPAEGTWRVEANFGGDGQRRESRAGCSFVVTSGSPPRIPTSINLLCPPGPSYIQTTANLSIPGTSDLGGVSGFIYMELEAPDGSPGTVLAFLDAAGNFEFLFWRNVAIGRWKVTGVFPGSATHEESSSQTCEFDIVPPPR